MTTKTLCQCNPETDKIQEYQRAVPVIIPSYIQLVRTVPEGVDLMYSVCIDACLVSEIWELWRKGIRTTGCCCGHNQAEPYIGVLDEDIEKMKGLGYKVHVNPLDPKREDSFKPKSLLSMEGEEDDPRVSQEDLRVLEELRVVGAKYMQERLQEDRLTLVEEIIKALEEESFYYDSKKEVAEFIRAKFLPPKNAQ